MVNTDEDTTSFLLGAESVQNRDRAIPLDGVRENLSQPAMQTMCIKDDDGNADDFVLRGYESCALHFSKKQFEQSVNTDPTTGFKQITLYVNHPQ
jgi:hypothetical protein